MGKTVEQYLDLAARYYNAGIYGEALNTCNCAIKLDPRNARAYHGRGLVFLQKGLLEEALENYQASYKLDSKNAKLMADMGELFYILKDYEQSGLCYREAIQLNSKFEADYRIKTKIFADEVINLGKKGLYKEALPIVRQALLFNPQYKQPYDEYKQFPTKPSTLTTYNSSNSYYPQVIRSKAEMEFIARENNQWDLDPSIHPANCRCHKCWEI